MKRLKGPELKMPALKIPTFVADLWWDLWDRRLLPLVVLIAAAIAAVPFLMGGGSKEVPESTLAALAAANAEPAVDNGATKLAVVQEEPGLRDYHERLKRLSPTNPFKQRFTAPVITSNLGGEGSGLTSKTEESGGGPSGNESGGGESSSGNESETVPSGPPSTEEEPSGGAPPLGGSGKRHLTFYTFAINVWVNRVGEQAAGAEGEQKPGGSVMKEVLPLTALPGKDAPVVTYMGVSKKRKPLLLVSNGVTSMSGEAKCLAGETTCQLLEVEPGFPVTFVYGPEQVSYTIKVLKVELVVVKRT